MNFKIVEQESNNSKYEAFKDLYMNSGLIIKDIVKKVNIGNTTACRYANEVYRETGWRRSIVRRAKAKKKENKKPRAVKYYCRTRNGYFIVEKWDKSRIVYYGAYRDEVTAKKVVEELKKVDWDKKELSAIKKRLGVKKGTPGLKGRNYTKVKYGYRVYRVINYKFTGFGQYKDEETAKRIVEELRKVDWDKEELPRIQEELGVKR